MFRRRNTGIASRPAFTLVELLVVIGIIAVLIALLLPSLNSARRSARKIKCAANLRTVGQAFNMYATTYKGVWPTARHDSGNPTMPVPVSVRWQDRIAPFCTGYNNMQDMRDLANQTTNGNNFDRLREASALWGCPEWTKISGEAAVAGEESNTGYGMQFYPLAPDAMGTSTADTSKWAYVSSTIAGKYYKVTAWTKPSDRLLVCDSPSNIVQVLTAVRTPGSFSRNNTWWPFPQSLAFGSLDIFVDGTRHGKSTTNKAESYKGGTYLNVLYCDGHVSSVSVAEAWNAIVNPGKNTAAP